MRRLVYCAAVLLSLTAVSWAADTPVEELWRSPFGILRSAASATDDSLWLAEGATVAKYTGLGQPRFRSEALHAPSLLAANLTDSSCWVVQVLADEVLHFASDGTRLSTTTIAGAANSTVLLVNQQDGSVWVEAGELVHLDASGVEVWRSSWPVVESAIWLSPNDGSVWATDANTGEAVHVAADGSEVERVANARVWAGDPRDGSLWYQEGEYDTAVLVHRAADGTTLARVANVGHIRSVLVSDADGSAWVCREGVVTVDAADRYPVSPVYTQVWHFSASGEELQRWDPAALQASGNNPSAPWINTGEAVVKLLPNGDEEARVEVVGTIRAYCGAGASSVWIDSGDRLQRITTSNVLAADMALMAAEQQYASTHWVDRSDHTVWVADLARPNTFLHLSRTGSGPEAETRQIPVDWGTVLSVAISPIDSSWSVVTLQQPDASNTGPVLHHLAPVGDGELWRHEGVGGPLALDETDGSVWTARAILNDEGAGTEWSTRLHHLAADGTVIGETEVASLVGGVAINQRDGSVWAGTYSGDTVKLLHFSPSGAALGEVAVPGVVGGLMSLAVYSGAGSAYCFYGAVWSDDTGALAGNVFAMSAGGEMLWQRPGFTRPIGMVVDPADGSLWVVDAGTITPPVGAGSAVVHLSSAGEQLWRSDAFRKPTAIDIDPDNGTVWVADSGNAQIVHLGTRLPFTDLRADFWATEAILACVDAGIVQGYWDDTYRPALPVTRDQMAVYLARGLAGGDGNVPTGPAGPSFTDVGEDSWAYKYVEYCVAQNIVEGYPGGGYHPEEVVNRGQMAVYLARTLVAPEGDAAIPHYDEMLIEPPVFIHDVAPTNEWAWCYDHVMYGVVHGVIQGYPEPDGSIWYQPGNAVLRDQMAVFVGRVFGLVPLPL